MLHRINSDNLGLVPFGATKWKYGERNTSKKQ